jgi:hypothetical protein
MRAGPVERQAKRLTDGSESGILGSLPANELGRGPLIEK